jgi:hypothetical protein
MERIEAFVSRDDHEINMQEFMKEALAVEMISVEFTTDTLDPRDWEPHKCERKNNPCTSEKFHFGKCLMTTFTITRDKLGRNLTGQDLDWIIQAAVGGSMAQCEVNYDKTNEKQLYLKFEE